ncbi:MAG: hypothetical protein RIQ33_2281 [Bacteroidota bacterium]|jgi:hypothetical protein
MWYHFLKILFLIALFINSNSTQAQSSLTKNTADEIKISSNVQWSDWGNNYTNSNGGNVKNYGTLIFYSSKFTNQGTYNSYAGSKDSFIATSADTIAGSSRARFYDIIIKNNNNAFVITNDSGIGVTNSINFASQIVSTTKSNLNIGAITFSDNATYLGTMSNSKFVDGYITKIGNDAFVFPVGNQNKYHPFTISAPTNSASEISVSYYYANPASADLSGGAHAASSLQSPLTSIDNTQFWDVITSNTEYVTVTINFESLVGKYFNISEVRMVGWNILNAQWEIIGNGMPTDLSSGNTITNESVNLSRFSAIGIGSILEILPIKLLQFNAEKSKFNSAVIQWQTASETNNKKFILQKSYDLKMFFDINEQAGAGNSNYISTYQFIDENIEPQINYYRLKQIATDGSIDYTQVIAIDFSNENSSNDDEIKLLDNDEFASLIIQAKQTAEYQISLVNCNGVVLSNYRLMADENSSTFQSIPLQYLPTGIYFIVVLQLKRTKPSTFKLIKKA